jgi:plasmid stability protein
MASMLIRQVDEALHTRLKAGAAAHWRSLEQEAGECLRAAVARQGAPPRGNPVTLVRRLFGSVGGVDLHSPPRGGVPESGPPDFSGPAYDPPGRLTAEWLQPTAAQEGEIQC